MRGAAIIRLVSGPQRHSLRPPGAVAVAAVAMALALRLHRLPALHLRSAALPRRGAVAGRWRFCDCNVCLVDWVWLSQPLECAGLDPSKNYFYWENSPAKSGVDLATQQPTVSSAAQPISFSALSSQNQPAQSPPSQSQTCFGEQMAKLRAAGAPASALQPSAPTADQLRGMQAIGQYLASNPDKVESMSAL